MFHKTTPDLQDQDRLFSSETAIVLRPTVSDHIIDSGRLFDRYTKVRADQRTGPGANPDWDAKLGQARLL